MRQTPTFKQGAPVYEEVRHSANLKSLFWLAEWRSLESWALSSKDPGKPRIFTFRVDPIAQQLNDRVDL